MFVVGAATIFGLAVVSAWWQDRGAATESKRIVDHALEEAKSALAVLAQDYTWWNEPITHFYAEFDPGYADMKTKLDAGLVGRPVLVHCAHRNPVVPPSFGSEMIVTDTVVDAAGASSALWASPALAAVALTLATARSQTLLARG